MLGTVVAAAADVVPVAAAAAVPGMLVALPTAPVAFAAAVAGREALGEDDGKVGTAVPLDPLSEQAAPTISSSVTAQSRWPNRRLGWRRIASSRLVR
ncbi:MAG TPA: hypothetical protein VFU72_15330 [Nitrolancea sp.]|nr:hypothetical protein [Nitrolancea sp.]